MPDPADLVLRALRVEDEAAARRAQTLLAREDFPFLFDFDATGDFATYVRRVEGHGPAAKLHLEFRREGRART